MSSMSMLRKAREDNLAMSALLKHATGERLTTEEKAVIEEFKKARELEARLAEKYDIGGAITKALRNRQGSKPVQFDSGAAMKDIGSSPRVQKKVKDGIDRKKNVKGVNWSNGTDPTGRKRKR